MNKCDESFLYLVNSASKSTTVLSYEQKCRITILSLLQLSLSLSLLSSSLVCIILNSTAKQSSILSHVTILFSYSLHTASLKTKLYAFAAYLWYQFTRCCSCYIQLCNEKSIHSILTLQMHPWFWAFHRQSFMVVGFVITQIILLFLFHHLVMMNMKSIIINFPEMNLSLPKLMTTLYNYSNWRKDVVY